MASVNIGSSNAGDEFYRYKMPALQSKARARARGRRKPKPQAETACFGGPQIEGRGNGIKTNVMNMVEVAKALGRPASCAWPRRPRAGGCNKSLPPFSPPARAAPPGGR